MQRQSGSAPSAAVTRGPGNKWTSVGFDKAFASTLQNGAICIANHSKTRWSHRRQYTNNKRFCVSVSTVLIKRALCQQPDADWRYEPKALCSEYCGWPFYTGVSYTIRTKPCQKYAGEYNVSFMLNYVSPSPLPGSPFSGSHVWGTRFVCLVHCWLAVSRIRG